ncbi:hypothetical protein PHMEG_00027687 [Phytophthora megakarya]|uniref:Uncharacterized protein n=1 Tax=Phytophthora megakarya TaxID=4795 RepID=A0A225V6M1_9STRA|nr:hypothetical protein PHMEG_00027687 [Phytophthora megakarya]
MQCCDTIAGSRSEALGVVVNTKQVRDRLAVLKQNAAAEERRSTLGSGIEVSLDANDVQSHYDKINGLLSEYVVLETIHLHDKNTKADQKKKKIELEHLCLGNNG